MPTAVRALCWIDGLRCCPGGGHECDREGDFCYRDYRTMTAACISMRWSAEPPPEYNEGNNPGEPRLGPNNI